MQIMPRDYFRDPTTLFDRRQTYPEYYSPKISEAADALLLKVNALLRALPHDDTRVTSGWRPEPINRKVGGAAKSHHTTGHAVDLADPTGELARAIVRNQQLLVELGLYLESPNHTKGWVHLQDVPPKSGNRVFNP